MDIARFKAHHVQILQGIKALHQRIQRENLKFHLAVERL